MKKAVFTTQISVTDPDTKNEVSLSIFKHENGGMFAIDSSFLDQVPYSDDNPAIPDPFFQLYDDSEDEAVELIGL